MSAFEEWLRETCFQPPPKHSYDLAKMAYKAGMLAAAEIAENKVGKLVVPFPSDVAKHIASSIRKAAKEE